jgi:hypothetical protein
MLNLSCANYGEGLHSTISLLTIVEFRLVALYCAILSDFRKLGFRVWRVAGASLTIGLWFSCSNSLGSWIIALDLLRKCFYIKINDEFIAIAHSFGVFVWKKVFDLSSEYNILRRTVCFTTGKIAVGASVLQQAPIQLNADSFQ